MPEHPPVVATQITDSPHFDPQRFYVVHVASMWVLASLEVQEDAETAAEKLSQMAQWPHASTFTANQAKLAESCLRLRGLPAVRAVDALLLDGTRRSVIAAKAQPPIATAAPMEAKSAKKGPGRPKFEDLATKRMTERELSSYFMGLTLRPSRHSDALGMAVVHESTGIVLCVTKDRLSATKARHAFLKAAKWEERSQFSRVELTNMARVAGALRKLASTVYVCVPYPQGPTVLYDGGSGRWPVE